MHNYCKLQHNETLAENQFTLSAQFQKESDNCFINKNLVYI